MDKGSKPAPDRIEAELPAEMARAFNLMAHPLAGMAAMSAIGFGMASQALGIWAGAMSGAVAASRQLAPKVAEALEPVAVRLDGAAPQPQPAPRKADVLTLIKDARTAVENRARAVAEAAVAAPPVVEKTAHHEPVSAPVKAAAKAEAPAKVARKAVAPGKPKVAAAVVAPAMAQPTVMAKPAQPDDLKAISGVGPKLEQVLNGMGIWTYGQIAAMTAGEIATIEDRLGFKGRIERDDWVGQAARLAASGVVEG
jgi:NADH-quinone oxidoreductase subunit E